MSPKPTSSDKLSRVDKARIDLWTAHDMVFVLDRDRGQGTIPRFTKCVKPPYTKAIRSYLDNMESKKIGRPDSNPKAVCVKLEGMLRYVWRTDVLTRKEYEEVKRKERSAAIGVFGSKSKRVVGEGGSD